MADFLVLESGENILLESGGYLLSETTDGVFLFTDLQKFNPSQVIELFALDLTPLGGDVMRFHNGVNELSAAVVWQGTTYNYYPIIAGGFDKSTTAQLPRPRLVVSNVNSNISALILQYGDLTGMKITRKRTQARFLDAVNFAAGNTDADPTAEYPDDIFILQQKVSEDYESVEYQLSSSIDLENVFLPRRPIVQNVCIWKYRGPECGYAGGPCANFKDQKLTLSDTVTTVEQDFINARDAMLAALDAKAAAAVTLQTATNAHNALTAVGAYVLLSTNYSLGGTRYYVAETGREGSTKTVTAYFAGASVSVGNVYRKGTLQSTNRDTEYYQILQYGPNTAAIAAALATKNAAQTAYNTAASTATTAVATYDAALLALTSDPNYNNLKLKINDVCGKRLSSCKLRFGENSPLPYGGFPAAGVTR